jgi:Recombination endonuclease VII
MLSDIPLKCRVCDVEKPASGFYEGGGRICKLCRNTQQRAYNKRTADTQNAQSQKRYQRNRAHTLARQQEKRDARKADPHRLEKLPPEKPCKRCSKTKPAADFYLSSDPGDGLTRFCRLCYKELYAINKTRWQIHNLQYRYNMSQDQWDAMLAAQDGKCAACGTTDPGGKHGRFNVDHDHKCCSGNRSCGLCVRSLLCTLCNATLGRCGESVERLQRLIAYLEKHRGK